MNAALVLSLFLSQADPSADPPAADTPAAVDPATPAAPGTPPNTPAPRRAFSQEDMQRQLDRIRNLPPGEMGDAMEKFRKQYSNAVVPAADLVANPPKEKPSAPLTEAQQVREAARLYLNSMLSGDARSLVLASAYPFQLEDRQLQQPDELHKEWLKNLRSKRTDLLTLYDIDVLTPAEMEKKYGKPPQRLNALQWRAPKTWLAVANLSGHASVVVVKQVQGDWYVVGYHD